MMKATMRKNLRAMPGRILLFLLILVTTSLLSGGAIFASDPGVLSGRVVFRGKAPAVQKIDLNKDV